MAITVTLNILLKAILCISIFDARHIKPSEKVCLFFGKLFMMFFCLVGYVMLFYFYCTYCKSVSAL